MSATDHTLTAPERENIEELLRLHVLADDEQIVYDLFETLLTQRGVTYEARLATAEAEKEALRAERDERSHTLADAEYVECACPPFWQWPHDPSPLCPAHHRDWLAAHDAEVARTAAKEAEVRWMKVAVMRDGEAIREAKADAYDEGVAAGQEWGRRVNASYPHNPYREEGRADGRVCLPRQGPEAPLLRELPPHPRGLPDVHRARAGTPVSAMTFLDLVAVVLFALVCILATVLGLRGHK